MDMQHGNGHATCTVTSSVDAEMLMKSFVRHHPFFVSLQHFSGISIPALWSVWYCVMN
jgi:hypothetical protein